MEAMGGTAGRGGTGGTGVSGAKSGFGTRDACEGVRSVYASELGGLLTLGLRGGGMRAKMRGLTRRLPEEPRPCMSVLHRCKGEDMKSRRRGGFLRLFVGERPFSVLPTRFEDGVLRRYIYMWPLI